MSIDVPSILYTVIDDIGREKIRRDIASNVSVCQKYCDEIMRRCRITLGRDASPQTLGTACEALMHFMLTASLLPSQRKLTVKGVELDLVIPSARVLEKSPEKSLVIQVIRNESDMAKISAAEFLQPVRSNIWLVSASGIITSYKNYNLDPDGSFSRLIGDIHHFVSASRISGLRLLPGE